MEYTDIITKLKNGNVYFHNGAFTISDVLCAVLIESACDGLNIKTPKYHFSKEKDKNGNYLYINCENEDVSLLSLYNIIAPDIYENVKEEVWDFLYADAYKGNYQFAKLINSFSPSWREHIKNMTGFLNALRIAKGGIKFRTDYIKENICKKEKAYMKKRVRGLINKKEKNIYKTRIEILKKAELADKSLIAEAINNKICIGKYNILNFEEYDCSKTEILKDFYTSTEYDGMIYKKSNDYIFVPFKSLSGLVHDIKNSDMSATIALLKKELKKTA